MPITTNIKRLQLWAKGGIQRKLVFWNIGFWVLSVSVLSLAFLWLGGRETISETRQRNVQLASIVSRDLNAQMSRINTDTRIFTRHMEESGVDLTAQAEALIAMRLSSPQHYRAVYYFDARGNLLLYLTDTLPALLSLSTADVVNRPPVQVAPAVTETYQMVVGNGAYFSDVYFTSLERTPVFYTGLPVTLAGNNKRVVVIELDLSDIWRRVELSTIGQSGFTYAVSEKGIIITHREAALVGTHVSPAIEPVLRGFEGFTDYIEPSGNRPVFAAYSPVGGTVGWGIVVEQDSAEAMAPLYRTGVLVVAVWVVLAILGTISILIMVRNFTRPVMELTRTAQEIAETGILKKTAMEQRPDEVGQLSAAFDQMVDRLQGAEGRVATAAAEERNRLARDLHDAVSQTLFSASLIAEVLPRIWEKNPAEGKKRLEEVRQLTRGALAEMRTLLLELRPAALVDAELGELLHQLAESITGRARVPVSVATDGECAIPTEVKVALYRIAQEALNNVAKHSGATQATVSLICSAEGVTLKVSDNGKGFEMTGLKPDSLGLGIMRERTKGIGASLTIDSRPGSGTEVVVVWKCPTVK